MSRFQLRRAHVSLASLVLLLSVACRKSDAPPPDSSASAAAQPLRSGTPSPRAKIMPGTLTKSVDAYTGDEFYDLVKQLSFSGGQDRQRNCKNDPGCGGANPTRHTNVRVDAVTTQDSIDASSAGQYGTVYVRALNKGGAPEARYGMLPGSKYEYYMIITADSTGRGMLWRLEQLDTTPKARAHSSVGTGQFVPCNHKWAAGARADFKTCANAASARDSVVRLGLALQAGNGDPIWAECAMGCCTGS